MSQPTLFVSGHIEQITSLVNVLSDINNNFALLITFLRIFAFVSIVCFVVFCCLFTCVLCDIGPSINTGFSNLTEKIPNTSDINEKLQDLIDQYRDTQYNPSDSSSSDSSSSSSDEEEQLKKPRKSHKKK